MAFAPQARPNRFYKKPKPETMKKNRESYADIFKEEISWIKDNLKDLTQNKHKFLIDMYTILITGSRKVTPKMAAAIKSSIIKCQGDPRYNETVRVMEEMRLKPILSKINVVLAMAEAKNDKGVDFIKNVQSYVKKNYRITKKQMEALNKVHKRVSENLFDKGDKDD
jgi:hypothetical protein